MCLEQIGDSSQSGLLGEVGTRLGGDQPRGAAVDAVEGLDDVLLLMVAVERGAAIPAACSSGSCCRK